MLKTKKRPPITARQFYRVVDLIEAGNSDRLIASEVGIARGSVSRIRRGYRPKSVRPVEAEPATGPLRRCAECGMLVNTPCVYCAAVAYRRSRGGAS